MHRFGPGAGRRAERERFGGWPAHSGVRGGPADCQCEWPLGAQLCSPGLPLATGEFVDAAAAVGRPVASGPGLGATWSGAAAPQVAVRPARGERREGAA